MATKSENPSDADSPNTSREPLKDSVRDSAQQIWQAGLGAFAKAQAEGTRAFEALVKEGSQFQRKTQSAAEEKMSEAASRMSSMASDLSSRASGHWGKLEDIFEDRVARALNKLGVPSAKEVEDLKARMAELDKAVKRQSARSAADAAPRKTAARAARPTARAAASPASRGSANKAGAKRATPRKST
ncbi:MAG: phasin family protein [Burkholderiaceae bacterium]